MQEPAAAPPGPTPFKPAGERADGEGRAAEGTISDSSLDDDDMDNWLSVAAIEAELKPNVIEIFDTIAGTYKRLRRLQGQDIQFQLTRLSLSPAQKRKHKKLKNEIIGDVKSLRLKQAHIDAPVEQLYDINKRLVALLRPKRSTLSGGIVETENLGVRVFLLARFLGQPKSGGELELALRNAM